MEAIAATAVCHQRNAIFGARRVYLCFDVFYDATRNTPHQVRRKKHHDICKKDVDGRDMGERKRRRPSDGYARP
jgi:hypothetical protein